MKALKKLLVAVMVMSLVVHPALIDCLLASDYTGADEDLSMPVYSETYQKVQDAVVVPPPEPEPETAPKQDDGIQAAVGEPKLLSADNANPPAPVVAPVPEPDQAVLDEAFKAKPTRSETTTTEGGTRTDYYDENNKLLYYSTQTLGTQYTQPTKWFYPDNKVIYDKKEKPFEATLVSAGDEQDAAKSKTDKTAAWKKVTYSEDKKVETTSYYTSDLKFAGAKKVTTGADGKPADTTWRTKVKAGADHDAIDAKVGGKSVYQEETTSADGKTTTTRYLDEDNKELGSKKVTLGADGKPADTTWKTKVKAGADQDAIDAKVGGESVYQEETTSADGKVTTKYLDANNKELGSKIVTKDAAGKPVETWRTRVPKDAEELIRQNIGETPVWQEEIKSADGKTTTIKFFNEANEAIGSVRIITEGTGQNKTVDAIWTVKVPAVDIAGVKGKTGETPVWQEVTKSADGKTTTTKYFNQAGAEIGSKRIATGADNKPIETWRVKVPAADQGGATTSLGVKPAWQEVSVSADGKVTTTKYFTEAGKEIGSKIDTTGADGKITTTYNATIKAPTKPTGNTVAEWDKYYTDYVVYINQLDDLTMRKDSWNALAADFLAQVKANPGTISAAIFNGIMNNMSVELRKKYKDSTYTLDLSKAQADMVSAANEFAKSSAFSAMDDNKKVGIVAAFHALGVELSWRKGIADDATLSKIGDFYKTILGGSGNSSYVTAYSFQALMGMWRHGVWGSAEGNKAGVDAILKQAMSVDGGIDKLIASWQAGLADGTTYNGEQQAWLANALGQVIWQNGALNAARKDGTAAISNKQMETMAGLIADFLGKVDTGKVEISANMKNHFINVVGSALIMSMYFQEGQNYKAVEAYQDLGAAYIALGNDVLTLSEKNGGSVALQTSVVNVTAAVWHHAKATGNTDKADACQNLLFNEDFNADTYLKNATAQMGDAKRGSDYKAWVTAGMNNLSKIRLEFDKAVATQRITDGIAEIKKWITGNNSLDNMRDMSRQSGVYTSLAGLLKEFCKTENKELDGDATLRANIVAIFKTLVSDTKNTSVKDSLVRSMGKKELSNLLGSLGGVGSKWKNLHSDLSAVLAQL